MYNWQMKNQRSRGCRNPLQSFIPQLLIDAIKRSVPLAQLVCHPFAPCKAIQDSLAWIVDSTLLIPNSNR